MPQTEPLTEAATAALEARGIDPEVADRYGVQSIVPDRRTRQTWILFPHALGGVQVHWTARTLDGPKKFHQQAGGQRCLWNHDAINDASLRRQAALIITEGHLDALSFMTAGFSAVTSVPDGAPSASGKQQEHEQADPGATAKYAYLAAIREQLREWQAVILATDADPAGDRLADDLARVIGRSRCRRAEYPPDCKDANDVLLKHGPEALIGVVERARWVAVNGVYQFDTLPQLELVPAVRAGVQGVDELWQFRTGEISVMCGAPNHGKSTLANQIGLALAMRHGWSVAWFTPEQHPTIHVDRLLTSYLGMAPRLAQKERLEEARAFIRNHVVWIAPETGEDATVEWLRERIATVSWRYNCRMAVIDPWNQLDHDRGSDWREDEYEREMLKRLRRTAVDCGMHLMILVHPRKPQTDTKDGKTPIPTGYSIAGSGHWVNAPDLGATIYRSDDHSLFRCWKARYADGREYDSGKIGERTLMLQLDAQRFVAPAEGWS
jgi:twinkle protein